MFNDYTGESGFWQEPDPFLVDLVSGFVNKGGMELGITLFIKGQVMTGTLVSEQDYLNAMSDMFAAQAKKSMVKPTKEELKATEDVFDFTHLAEDIDPAAFMPDVAEDDDDFDIDDNLPLPLIRHLHLKDPVILQPQPAISFSHSQISIVRIRLIAIDGWMIGKVTVEDDSLDDDFMPPPSQIRH
ncbi:MAG: hypothetical protein ABI690_10540 [Chloroflexota bacterium]